MLIRHSSAVLVCMLSFRGIQQGDKIKIISSVTNQHEYIHVHRLSKPLGEGVIHRDPHKGCNGGKIQAMENMFCKIVWQKWTLFCVCKAYIFVYFWTLSEYLYLVWKYSSLLIIFLVCLFKPRTSLREFCWCFYFYSIENVISYTISVISETAQKYNSSNNTSRG